MSAEVGRHFFGSDWLTVPIALYSYFVPICVPIVERSPLTRVRDAPLRIVLAERRLRHIGNCMCRQPKPAILLIHTQSTPKNAPADARAHAVVLWYNMCWNYPTPPDNALQR